MVSAGTGGPSVSARPERDGSGADVADDALEC